MGKKVLEDEKEEIVGVPKGHHDATEHEEDSDTVELEMETGEKDEDVYTEEGRQKLQEDDEIEPWEEGFAKGAQPDKHHGQ